MNRILAGLATLLFCIGSPANLLLATDYYVTAQGAASGGDGSANDPWGTITEALTSGVLVPGDTVNLAAGGYSDIRGETIPLPMVDGITLKGQSTSATVISSLSSSTAMFQLGGFTNPTVISDLTLEPKYTAIFISDSMADLQVRNCVWNGGLSWNYPFLYFTGSGSGPVNVTISGCGFGNYDDTAVSWWDTSATAPHTLTLRNNDFGSTDDGGVYFYESRNSSQVMLAATGNLFGYNSSECFSVQIYNCDSADLQFNDNEFIGCYYTEMYIYLSADTTGFVQNVNLGVHGNHHLGGDSECFELFAYAYATSAVHNLTLDVEDNCYEAGNYEGMSWWFNARYPGAEMRVGGMVSGNACLAMDSTGFEASGSADSGGLLVVDYEVARNEFVGNEWEGAWMWFGAFSDTTGTDGPGEVRAPILFYENTLVGNGSEGVDLQASQTGGGVISQWPVFGSSAMPGKNTIRANDTDSPTTSGTDFYLTATSTGVMISAYGNFWTNDTLTSIEARVYHGPDGNSGTVDFSGALPPMLTFTGPPAAAVGQLVMLLATGGSCFVQKAGKTEITVKVDGILVPCTVLSNGTALSFTVPVGVALGTGQVVVMNPGGQIGGLLMALSGAAAGNGRCFVATAAYGDDEAPEVLLLRRWRDESLSTNALGRLLVKAYYAVSPPLAEAIAESPAARTVSRAALAPVVGAVKLWLDLPWVFGLAGAVLLLRLLRRKA